MTRPVEDIQVASVANVGKGITWPQFTLALEENDREAVGSRIQISGATCEQAVVWLRTAALAIEQGRSLRIMGFDGGAEHER